MDPRSPETHGGAEHHGGRSPWNGSPGPGPGNYLMATIPITNAPVQFYTVGAQTPGCIRRQPPWRCGGAASGRTGPRMVGVPSSGSGRGQQWRPERRRCDVDAGRELHRLGQRDHGHVNAQTATGSRSRSSAARPVLDGRASMPTARRALAADGRERTGLRHRRAERLGHRPAEGGGLQSKRQRVDHKASLPALGRAARCRHDQRDRISGRRRGRCRGLTRTLYAYNASTDVWSTQPRCRPTAPAAARA